MIVIPDVPPGVIGVGIDIVSVPRFAAAIARTPALLDRLLADSERVTVSGSVRSVASLAARFAAKEAVAKALGVPRGLEWHDCLVAADDDGRPRVQVAGTVADACRDAGIDTWRISLTHDAGLAAAVVIGISETSPRAGAS